MGRSLESGSQFSSLAPKVKKHPASDRSANDDKLQRRGDRRTTLPRVTEEEEGHVRRRRWAIRVRRGKLVTPVVHHLKQFRQSCASMATKAAAPLRCYKLGVLLAKLHLSRKRNSRKIHSILTYSSPSDEHAPLLPLYDPEL